MQLHGSAITVNAGLREVPVALALGVRSAVWLVVVAAVVLPAVSDAQSLAMARAGIAAPITAARSSAGKHTPSLLVATLASAAVPGAGQALLGSRRAFAYAAAEAVGWVTYSVQVREGNRQRARYRELARTVARAQFTPDGPAGNWDYFERMEKFAVSGAYDAIPGGAIDPEPDPTTFNGSIWLLARQTYWRDLSSPPSNASPEYQSALSFYERRAVPPEMRWSWDASPDGYQQYRRSIAASNGAFKRVEQTVGLVIANHILSVVDAYVSVRMRRDSGGRTSVTAGIPFGGSR